MESVDLIFLARVEQEIVELETEMTLLDEEARGGSAESPQQVQIELIIQARHTALDGLHLLRRRYLDRMYAPVKKRPSNLMGG